MLLLISNNAIPSKNLRGDGNKNKNMWVGGPRKKSGEEPPPPREKKYQEGKEAPQK